MIGSLLLLWGAQIQALTTFEHLSRDLWVDTSAGEYWKPPPPHTINKTHGLIQTINPNHQLEKSRFPFQATELGKDPTALEHVSLKIPSERVRTEQSQSNNIRQEVFSILCPFWVEYFARFCRASFASGLSESCASRFQLFAWFWVDVNV